MRVGTWNVEYARPSRNLDRLAILQARDADIWVLTETHYDLDLSATHVPVHSLPRPQNKSAREGSTWVTIWSRYPLLYQLPVPDERRMVAAVFKAPQGSIAVAGVVLPWKSDRGDEPRCPDGPDWEEHRCVLNSELPQFFESLQSLSGVVQRILAGDFNNPLRACPIRG